MSNTKHRVYMNLDKAATSVVAAFQHGGADIQSALQEELAGLKSSAFQRAKKNCRGVGA